VEHDGADDGVDPAALADRDLALLDEQHVREQDHGLLEELDVLGEVLDVRDGDWDGAGGHDHGDVGLGVGRVGEADERGGAVFLHDLGDSC